MVLLNVALRVTFAFFFFGLGAAFIDFAYDGHGYRLVWFALALLPFGVGAFAAWSARKVWTGARPATSTPVLAICLLLLVGLIAKAVFMTGSPYMRRSNEAATK